MIKPLHPCALYVHWPHPKKLYSISPERYYLAIKEEISKFVEGMKDLEHSPSLFMGGFPDLYKTPLLLDTSDILRRICSDEVEFSIEISRVVLQEEFIQWNQIGVNRFIFSVRNAMSCKWVDIIQRAAAVCDHIGLDVFLGKNFLLKSLQDICARVPLRHISVYFPEQEKDEDLLAEQYLSITEALQEKGFEQYSTYDFAQRGYQSIQQQTYLNRGSYRGFGVGACSFDGSTRYQNVVGVEEYCKALEGNGSAWCKDEAISTDMARVERIFLGLTGQGISVEELLEGCAVFARDRILFELKCLHESGLIEITQGIVVLTSQGRLVENEIITKIYWK